MESELTLADVAELASEQLVEPDPEQRARIAAHVRGDPRLAEPLERLRRMAEDAGLDPDEPFSLLRGWEVFQDSRRLIESERAWREPADVLDPTGVRGVDYGALRALLEARSRRESLDPTVLGRVRAADRCYRKLMDTFVRPQEAILPGVGREVLGRIIAGAERGRDQPQG